MEDEPAPRPAIVSGPNLPGRAGLATTDTGVFNTLSGNTGSRITYQQGSFLGFDTGSSNIIYSNAIGDSYPNMGLMKLGLGTLSLYGANSYGGGTAIQNGTLAVSTTLPLPAGTVVTLGDAANDSGELVLGNGFNQWDQTLAGLYASGSGTGNRVPDGGTGMATLTLNVSGTDAFGGILGGSGNQNNLALVMDGTGKLILNGASTYTGGTTVSAGELRVTGSITSAVSVSSGATLSGIGATGPVTVNGTVSPGVGGAGALSVSGSVTFAAGSVFDANLTNAGCGQLDVTGTVNLANSALDVASTPTQTQDGDAFVLVRNEGGASCGTFSNFPTDGGAVNAGYVITYSYNAATGTPGAGKDVALISRPAAPGALTATPVSGTEIDLAWSASPRATQYLVEYQVNGAGAWNVADGGPLSGLGCPVSGLTVGPDAYSFRVSAVDSGGIWSVYSVAAVATSEVSIQTIQAPDECLLQPGIFQVTRTGATLPITVGYSIAGSVVAGVDYEPLPGSVVIPAGATSEDITMTTLNDPNMTDNLPFTVTLSSGAGYLLASGQSQAASQLYDGTAYQWHFFGGANADGSGGVSVSFSGVEMESHVEGAWCRVPSESQYAVALGLNLSTNIKTSEGQFVVGISNTPVSSTVTPSGQFSWAGTAAGGGVTSTDVGTTYFSASDPDTSLTEPVYLNAYYSVRSVCAPGYLAGGTLDPKALSVDVCVDSNNDGHIDQADEKIKHDASLPGKIIVADQLDMTGDGVPGFADGINEYGNNVAGRCNNFAPVQVTVPSDVDPSRVKITFNYSAADPSLATQTCASGGLATYQPGSSGFLRLWTADGPEVRNVASVAQGGNYVVPGTAYPATDFFQSGATTATLYAEGINESGQAQAPITATVSFAADSSNQTASDYALTTVAWVQIVYTDVSGISGTATQVTRIPPTQEPDGIAADWQQGVSDGAMLEMRVVGSAVLENLITQSPSAFSIAFGYTPQSSGAFTSLPTDASQGTYYVVGDPNFVPNATSILHSMGIENVGEVYANSVHYVLAAELYMPPCEFDPTNSLVAISSRKLSLAISLAGEVSVTGSKPNAITLTRPPVVLVNGINCNPAPNAGPRAYWGGDGGNSMLTALSNAGYNYFLADNSGADTTNATLEASGDTWGCGELTDMWTVVSAEITVAEGDYNQGYIPAGQGRDGVDSSGNWVSHILFPTIGGRDQCIAVQKVDIVAHSYGGLLARWYVEQATAPGSTVAGSLFASREDVRSLIELGTPNQGSPLANMVDEVFKGTSNPTGQAADESYTNGVIAGANVNVPAVSLSLGNTLARMDRTGYTGNLTPFPASLPILGNLQLPTALDTLRTQPLPFYQDASINSAELAQLNANPFNPDVSYAAVIGTAQPTNYLSLLEPIGPTGQSLFPWMNTFDGAGSDGVVPGWSAQLGVAAFNQPIAVGHTQMQTSSAVQSCVLDWLTGTTPNAPTTPQPMPLGSAQRAAWNAGGFGIPVSDRNAYQGSSVVGGTSTVAGLNRNAIVKVELDPSDSTPYYGTNGVIYGCGPDDVGLQPVAITGMIQVQNIGLESIQIDAGNSGWVSGEVGGPALRNLAVLSQAQLNIPASALVGAQPGDYVPFCVTTVAGNGVTTTAAYIGRTADGSLTGPDGVSTQWGATQYAGYVLSVPGQAPLQSPFTGVVMPTYAYGILAPQQTGVNPNGTPPTITLLMSGSVATSGLASNALSDGTTSQTITVDTYYTSPAGSGILVTAPVSVPQPAGVWNGLLIPYSFNQVLYFDLTGVYGYPPYVSSGTGPSNPVGIYQYLVGPNLQSVTTTITPPQS